MRNRRKRRKRRRRKLKTRKTNKRENARKTPEAWERRPAHVLPQRNGRIKSCNTPALQHIRMREGKGGEGEEDEGEGKE